MNVAPGETERGSALLLVVWMSALMAAILIGVIMLAHNQVRATAGDRVALQREAALQSALEIVAFDISQIGRSHVAQLPVQIDVGGYSVRVSQGRTQVLIDINMANEQQFAALFRQLGHDDLGARTLADRIMDWRDSDQTPRALGGESEAYSARPASAPRNRPFVSVEELQHVLGMSPRLWACAAPYLTVLGGTPLPVRESGSFEATTDETGMRVALLARTITVSGAQHEMAGLAEFRSATEVPFEWVAFGDDRLRTPTCLGGGGA
ncbi:type II secretion system protein GspK [Maricaulis sp.]|uniref:general secretion pathway protein GspK n=1 Tax=Maricaulis sp. TaxID=1486257 RepID=UPI001B1FCB47|nr:type II secretion system protein GspK [Maricaulis sp.]MBO6797767.1 general secretion pathway protein GspK [Maricaulis sp.]